MAEFTIYIGNKNYSSWSLRPWLALRHTGVAFEEVDDPARPDRTRRRISGAIRRAGACRCSGMARSRSGKRWPSASTWPSSFRRRDYGPRIATPAPLARAVSNEMHAGFAALRDHLPMDISRRWPLGESNGEGAGADVERIAAIWRECRERFGSRGANGAGDFLFGGFTIADAMFAPVTTRFLTYSVPLDPVCSALCRGHAALARHAGLDRRRQGRTVGDQRRCQCRRRVSDRHPSCPPNRVRRQSPRPAPKAVARQGAAGLLVLADRDLARRHRHHADRASAHGRCRLAGLRGRVVGVDRNDRRRLPAGASGPDGRPSCSGASI